MRGVVFILLFLTCACASTTANYVLMHKCNELIDWGDGNVSIGIVWHGIPGFDHGPREKDFESVSQAVDWLNNAECTTVPQLFLKREIPLERIKVGTEMRAKKVTVKKMVVHEKKRWFSNYSISASS